MSESPSPNGWTTMNKRPRYKRLADDDVNPKENYYVSLAATMLLLLIAVPAWGPYAFSQIWRCREALKMIRFFALCHPLLWPRWLTDLSRSTSRLSKKAGWRCLKAKVRTAGGFFRARSLPVVCLPVVIFCRGRAENHVWCYGRQSRWASGIDILGMASGSMAKLLGGFKNMAGLLSII